MRDYIVPPVPDTIWQKPTHFIAFGFGTGALPYAPGTFGTLIAIPFYLALQNLPWTIYLGILFAVILGSIWLCHRVAKEINVHDHQGMCLDEVVGYLVTMFNAPHGLIWVLLGFGLFRFFDIVKPWPISYMDEKIPGGAGVILDDVAAGIFSCAILQILGWIF